MTARSLAGPDVDASHLRRIVEERAADDFDPIDLEAASIFAPYFRADVRLKVRTTHDGGETFERTGRVGITTGRRPAVLLVHRSSDLGSWDVLGPRDEIVAVWTGRRYEPVGSGKGGLQRRSKSVRLDP